MLDFSQLNFRMLTLHHVGNKARKEGLQTAEQLYPIADGLLSDILLEYFLNPFVSDEFYRFTHPTNLLDQNHLFVTCQQLFEQPDSFLEQSRNIAQHLYAASQHPKVRSGELFVAYFTDCVLDDEVTQAIGIFKSENKQTFLKADAGIQCENGINIKRLDKGCLILNIAPEDGYRIMTVDRSSRSEAESQAWQENFLQIARLQDNAYNTQNYIQFCQDFCDDMYPKIGDKKEQVLLMNKSLNYFSGHEQFDIEHFAEEVLQEPAQLDEFRKFKDRYDQVQPSAVDSFQISQVAVKLAKRRFKTHIKLDTNIDIKLNLKEDAESVEYNLEKGFDETRQMHYYKAYFNEEL